MANDTMIGWSDVVSPLYLIDEGGAPKLSYYYIDRDGPHYLLFFSLSNDSIEETY